MDRPYYSLSDYCKDTFGEKLYRLSLNGGFTCPNRDGTLGYGGCIFCSGKGSGEFASDLSSSVEEQIENAKKKVAAKFKGSRYIAYFQSFTNTYASPDRLRELYLPVVKRDDIAVLSIATRPDCLGSDVMEVLLELKEYKPVWIELGLQSSNEKTAEYIRRGYETKIYDAAVEKLNSLGFETITHVILGLPGETRDDTLETVRHVVEVKSHGIKLQLLHVIKDTDLAKEYLDGKFDVLTLEDYISILRECVSLLPKDMVVHRITGDGDKRTLIAPLWSADKKKVLNLINKALSGNDQNL